MGYFLGWALMIFQISSLAVIYEVPDKNLGAQTAIFLWVRGVKDHRKLSAFWCTGQKDTRFLWQEKNLLERHKGRKFGREGKMRLPAQCDLSTCTISSGWCDSQVLTCVKFENYCLESVRTQVLVHWALLATELHIQIWSISKCSKIPQIRCLQWCAQELTLFIEYNMHICDFHCIKPENDPAAFRCQLLIWSRCCTCNNIHSVLSGLF